MEIFFGDIETFFCKPKNLYSNVYCSELRIIDIASCTKVASIVQKPVFLLVGAIYKPDNGARTCLRIRKETKGHIP